MSFKVFIEAVKSIITVGASANACARQEIRDITGELADELDRALSLADSYLIGAKFSVDDHELSRYLADVDSKLMGSFHEHHICAGLYQLADKFEQIFDPTRFAVSFQNYQEIPQLVNELKNGEQVVLDDLQEMAYHLRDYSDKLDGGRMNKDEILKSIEYHRSEIKKHRSQIKAKRRELMQKL